MAGFKNQSIIEKIGVIVYGCFKIKTYKSLQRYIGTYIDGCADNKFMIVK